MNTYDHGVIRTMEYPCGKKVEFMMLSAKSSGRTYFHVEIEATHPDGTKSRKQVLDLRDDTLVELALLFGWLSHGGLDQHQTLTEEDINASNHS